jgi:hypothetical protein
MLAPRGREVYLLLILDLGTRWGLGQRHAPAVLYPRETTPRYQWPQSWSVHRNYRQYPLPLQGIEPRSSSLSDTILTELPQLPTYIIRDAENTVPLHAHCYRTSRDIRVKHCAYGHSVATLLNPRGYNSFPQIQSDSCKTCNWGNGCSFYRTQSR